MKNLSDTSGNRTRDPLACSAVAELIAPPRTLQRTWYRRYNTPEMFVVFPRFLVELVFIWRRAIL
jgi:hypothetical protein